MWHEEACSVLSFQSTSRSVHLFYTVTCHKKGKGSPYSIIERRLLELILIFGSLPAGDVNHKPGGRLPLLSTRPAVTLATLKRAATSFAAWWTQARWVWTVCLRHPTSSQLRLEPGPFCAWVQHANYLATEPPCHIWTKWRSTECICLQYYIEIKVEFSMLLQGSVDSRHIDMDFVTLCFSWWSQLFKVFISGLLLDYL